MPEQHALGSAQAWPLGVHSPPPQTPFGQVPEQQSEGSAQTNPFGSHALPQ
jgi:hypothetical protein